MSFFVASELEKLEVINDPRIVDLRVRLQPMAVSKSLSNISCQDLFFDGHYELARQICITEDFISNTPDSMISAAKLNLPPKDESQGLRDHVHTALINIYDTNETTGEAAEHLQKLSLNWRSAPFTNHILFEVARFNRNIEQHYVAALFLFYDFDQISYCDRTMGLDPNSECFDRFYYLRHIHAQGNRQFDLAYATAIQLQKSDLPFYRLIGILSEIRALTSAGNLIAALTSVVEHGCKNSGLLDFFDVPQIMQNYEFADLQPIKRTLIPSIAFCILDHYGQTQYSALHCKMACKQLLKDFNIDLPSEFGQFSEKFKLIELVFFLRYVCTQTYLELCSTLKSPMDLNEERIRICQLLSTLDSDNIAEYNKEIVDLTFHITTEKGIKVVESTRVYVNDDALVHWAETELKDLYTRYLAHVKAGILDAPLDIARRIEAVIASSGKESTGQFLQPDDFRADGILHEFMKEFSSAFLVLPRYGLNSFLGTRVRHGSLDGYFRGRFESRKLILFKDMKAGRYIPSKYWTDKLCGSDIKILGQVNAAFSDFSLKVDSILADAVLNRIQIKDSGHPDGIIEFFTDKFNAAELLNTWSNAGKFMTSTHSNFTEFAKACIDTLFWPALVESLKLVQNFVKNSLNQRLIEALDKFATRITFLVGIEVSREFCRDIVLVREDLSQASDLVASWFSGRGTYDETQCFTLTEICNIALTAEKNMRPNFSPEINLDISDAANQPITMNIGVLLDAMVIIFDNVSRRSGHEDCVPYEIIAPQIKITAELKSDGYLVIKTVSDLHKNISISTLREKITGMKEIIANGDYLLKSQSERGGSGLYRLTAMLFSSSSDFFQHVEFGVQEDEQFFVELTVLKAFFDRNSLPMLRAA